MNVQKYQLGIMFKNLTIRNVRLEAQFYERQVPIQLNESSSQYSTSALMFLGQSFNLKYTYTSLCPFILTCIVYKVFLNRL